MPDTHPPPSDRAALPRRMTGHAEVIETSAPIGDAVKTTTCYMCACRCGIKVHLKDGRVRYIEGNPDHPVNRGVLCGKGSAGIMTQYAPSRLRAPLKRVGPRGSGEFAEISWAEAMEMATGWLRDVRETDPRKLAFFTGRDQSQSLTGFWAAQFGTPNFAAHGGFCSVNMAAAGLYTIGGSFWEFGEPDWDHAKYFVMFGVAEDHDSNPIKIGLGKLKERGAKFVSVNPIRTGYSAIADEWVGIRPGTDGLLVMALMHELLRTDRVDLDFLVRYTNAHWLVVKNPGGADDGLFARDAEGRPLAWDRARGATDASAADLSPQIVGDYALPDGRKAVPVFQLMAERYLSPDYAPDAVAERCGVPAATIRRLAAEIADIAFNQHHHHRAALDRRARPPARDDGRPAGVLPRDARHLRAFQRLPHLPRAAPAADAARRDRCAGLLALQIALPAADPAGAGAGRQGRASRTRRWRATSSPSRTGRTTCSSMMTARPSASTRRSPGTRRCRCTA